MYGVTDSPTNCVWCVSEQRSVNQYDHLGEVTSNLQGVKIAPGTHMTHSYDHLGTWASKMPAGSASPSGASSVSRTPFKPPGLSEEVLKAAAHRHIPPNYEEPWDSNVGQQRFNRIMNRAEKTHERKTSQDTCVASRGPNSEYIHSGSPKTRPNVNTTKTVSDSVYEAAWQPKQSPSCEAESERAVSPGPALPHGTIPSNYEDAWDLPEKQKQFEAKIQQAQKQRASQEQLRGALDGAGTAPVSVRRMNRRSDGAVRKKFSSSTPISPSGKWERCSELTLGGFA